MDYEKYLQELLKTQLELETGTYKKKSNKQKLEEFNKDLKRMGYLLNKPNEYIKWNNTCTTDCKVGQTQKAFNEEMKPITIKEMQLGTTYKNKYIKLEIITELMMMTSIMFLGKDDNGDLVLIAIYNFENHYGTKDYQKLSYIFQKGKYILVLEPFYKMFGSGDDGIRIEDPNEIIIFDDKKWLDKFIKTNEVGNEFELLNENKIDEKENYNELYKEANKSFCLELYTTALPHFIKLKSLKPDNIEIDIKLAECYYGLPYYSKAIKKCDEILNKDFNNNIDILFLKIKSLLALKQVLQAKAIFDKNIELLKGKNISEYNRIEDIISARIDNMNGKFKFDEIYDQSKKSFNIDIGEYLNKKLEIRKDKKNGICIYTKEPIERGELLLVSKAIVASDLQKENRDKEKDKRINMQFDSTTKEEFQKTGSLLAYKDKNKLEDLLSYKLSNYPEDYQEFFQLYDGNNINLDLEQRKKNKNCDLKKIQKVIRYNSHFHNFIFSQPTQGLFTILLFLIIHALQIV